VTGKRPAAVAVFVSLLCLAIGLAAQPAAHVTVDAPPALKADASRIARIDLERLGDALRRAGLELPPRVQVTLILDEDPRAQRVPRWYAGLANGDDIIIFPERVSSYPYDSIETVFQHELVHVALDARAAGQPLPRWFHEGTATAVESGWSVADRVRLLAAAATEPAVEDVARLFESPAEPQTTHAYRLAAALMDELRRAHGAALPGRIAAEVARGVPFDRAFASQTGVTPNEAARDAWRSYRRWTSWVPAVTDPASTWSLILGLAFVAFFVRLWKRARRRRQWDEEETDPIP
jgi:hypothetical protein